jgi:multiple sugar transport system permease protein
MVVVGSIGLGMAMALVLNEEFKSRGIVRSIALMPWAVARVIVAQMWLLIYDSQYGYLNGILYQLGLIDRYVPFLAHGFRALNLIGVTYIWSYAPLCYLLLLAQLQAVPKNLYAAAKVDGANAWQRFWHVTLPWLRPMLLLVLILATIDAIMAFDLFFVLTGGGPGSATTVISWLGYSTAFAFFRMSDGAAILYTLSLICLILAYFYMRLLYRGAEARRRVAVPTAEELASRGVMLSVVGGVGGLKGSRTFARAEVRRSLLGGKVGQRLKSALLYACVVLIAFWSLAPFYTTVLASLLPLPSIIKVPPQWIPIPGTLQNYKDIFFGRIGAGEFGAVKEVGMVLPGIRNSFIVATVVTFVNAIIGGLAGYAYARYARYRVMGASLWVLMMTRMIPALTLVIPMFVIFRRLTLASFFL